MDGGHHATMVVNASGDATVARFARWFL